MRVTGLCVGQQKMAKLAAFNFQDWIEEHRDPSKKIDTKQISSCFILR